MYESSSILEWLKGRVGMRLSRLKTFAEVTAAAMRMKGVGVLALGRAMQGPARPKHRIKRVWRFFRNPGVEVLNVSRAIFDAVIPGKGYIVILADWTDLDPFQQLVFSLPRDGRSLPFLCVTIPKQAGEGSMVAAEQKALAYLSTWIPEGREVVMVADRGFGNTRWLADVKNWGWHFVQRVQGELLFEGQNFPKPIKMLEVVRGAPSKNWGGGLLTQEKPTPCRLVTLWEKDSKEPWYLVTDLEKEPAPEIVRIYKRRMWIEAMFRDLKNRNWGLGLDATRLSEPKRHDRLFIVLALAYFLLSAFGAAAETTGIADDLKANTVPERVMTLARIGNYFLQVARCPLEIAIKTLLELPP